MYCSWYSSVKILTQCTVSILSWHRGLICPPMEFCLALMYGRTQLSLYSWIGVESNALIYIHIYSSYFTTAPFSLPQNFITLPRLFLLLWILSFQALSIQASSPIESMWHLQSYSISLFISSSIFHIHNNSSALQHAAIVHLFMSTSWVKLDMILNFPSCCFACA